MIKNIVIVCSDTEVTNGAVQVAVEQAALLAEKGLNVYYFAGSGEPVQKVDERLKNSPNIKVISLGYWPTKHNPSRLQAILIGMYNFHAARELRRLLSTLDRSETVIHFHSWSQVLSHSVLKTAVKMKFKTFITLHDYRLACPNTFLFNNTAMEICELKPMSLRCLMCNCDMRHYSHKIWRYIIAVLQNFSLPEFTNGQGDIGYIFISEFSRKQLLRRIKAHRNQFLVKNPIYFRNRFRVNAENNSNFLFIGRLSEEKGIRNFCEAIHNTKVKGVVIGEGFLKRELEAKYPEIEFTGWQNKEQIHEHIKEARCLIFTSIWYEASPLTPLEVNAYGIPVIASDCSAASDNASFIYHSQKELEDLIIQVNTQDIKQLSIDTFNNFDESSTINYADNLLKVYNTPLMTE